jgi:hypothetical protein
LKFIFIFSNVVFIKMEKAPCEYLRMHLTLEELRKLCDALEVQYNDHATAPELCAKIKEQRPDLMRGRTWNFLRALLRKWDSSTDNGMYSLKHKLDKWYGMKEIGSYFWGNDKTATGYAKFAHQRTKARRLMGRDTRSWFGLRSGMLNSPGRAKTPRTPRQSAKR